MGKNKILVVDDDKGIVALVEHMLMDNGYSVSTAYDGNEALKTRLRFLPTTRAPYLPRPGLIFLPNRVH